MTRALISILLMAACALNTAAQTVDAVVLQSATEVDCRDLRNTRISEQRVYRLLHERASDMARFEIACSKWQKLTDFNGQVPEQRLCRRLLYPVARLHTVGLSHYHRV